MADVSIITPYRNAASFLPGLVETLRRQTFPDWECLLVDDQSSDGGPSLLAQLTAGDQRFRSLALPSLAEEPSHGRLPAVPRNLGISQASAPLVAFLDVDDLWHPRKLERQLAFHRSLDLDLSVTAYGRFRSMDRPVEALRCPPAQLRWRQLQQHNPLPLLTIILRRELLGAGFCTTHHEDYLQWLNLKHTFPDLRYGCLNEILACYRLHDANITRRRPSLLAWTYRVFRLHGFSRSQSMIQMGHWTLHQTHTLLQEFQQRRQELPTAAALLGAAQPQLIPPTA